MTSMTSRLGAALDFSIAHHDLVTTAALRGAGLDPSQIRALVRDGILQRIVRGLYRLRGTRTPEQDAAAATMRHGRSAASHVTALFVHGLDEQPPELPLITLPPGHTGRGAIASIRRSPLAPIDRTHRQRIPVTTVARSIVDAAEQLSLSELGAVMNEAISRKMVTVSMVASALDRVETEPGRIGSGRVREVLLGWTDAIKPDSPAEAAAIRRIVSHGLPAPTTQHSIVDEDGEFVARVDMAWPDDKVIREYDSDRYHGPDQIERGERRLQRLEALGWTVDSLERHHLLPSRSSWLRRLERDLNRTRASR